MSSTRCRVVAMGALLATGLGLPCAAQIAFTDQTSLLNGSVFSGAPIAIADMNADGKDDLVRLNGTRVLTVDYQGAPGGAFTQHVHGSLGTGMWAVCVADVDHNGYNDVFAGPASGGIRLLSANASGTAYSTSILPDPVIFVQGSLFADLDNDGSIDIFACDDNEDNHKYRNDGFGGFTKDDTLMDTSLPAGEDGNYAAIWTDFDNDGACDLYLSKCRNGVTSASDPRRVNRLFRNNGDGTFTDVASTAGLADGSQSWCADFGDIDNDGDLDCFLLNHGPGDTRLLENDGSGVFSDITTAAGLGGINYYGLQTVFRDFDNDTFIDILVSATNVGGSGLTYRVYRNSGNKTFSALSNVLVESGDGPIGHLHSFAIGDLNHDGFPDIYGSRGEGFTTPSTTDEDLLFLNDGNANHFLAVQLVGRTTNPNAIGARLELHGPWGVQLREVRAGEGYGIQNSLTKIFGLGTATAIDKLVVKWPSGVTEEILTPAADQYLQLMEGDNLDPGEFSAPVITSSLTAAVETGRAISYRVRGDNLPTSFSISSAPAGMTIIPSTGVLVWTAPAAGSLSVEITASNPAGSDRETLVLTVTDPPPPVITSSLASVALVGAPFAYEIGASNEPIAYSIANEPTGMTVDAVTGRVEWVPSATGSFSVDLTVLNGGGSDTRTLMITVGDLGVALNAGNLVFSTSPDAPWFEQSAVTRDGLAVQSGDIDHNGRSSLQTIVNGPGTLTFWWNVSSEPGFDYLRFLVDGALEEQISGNSGWRQFTYEVEAGTHTLNWSYQKDESESLGADAGYLDLVSYSSPDTDGDGLDDAWELANFGNLESGADDDPDFDGQTNAAEEVAGTNPTDPSSLLKILSLERQPNGSVELLFSSVPGKLYQVEASPDLITFGAVGSTVSATEQSTTVPVVLTSGGVATPVTLVAPSATGKVLVPGSNLGTLWRGGDEAGFALVGGDASWASVVQGIGYDATGTNYDTFIATDLQGQMYNARATAYLRLPFTVEDPLRITSLTLRLRFDDGFVAWINGVDVEGQNVAGPPGNRPATWSTGADGNRSDSAAASFASFDLATHLGALQAGTNILAIRGLNDGSNSSDFLIQAELLAEESEVLDADEYYFRVKVID